MRILVDSDGREAVRQLCDVALRVNGLANLDGVNTILGSVTMIEEEGDGTESVPLKVSRSDTDAGSVRTSKE